MFFYQVLVGLMLVVTGMAKSVNLTEVFIKNSLPDTCPGIRDYVFCDPKNCKDYVSCDSISNSRVASTCTTPGTQCQASSIIPNNPITTFPNCKSTIKYCPARLGIRKLFEEEDEQQKIESVLADTLEAPENQETIFKMELDSSFVCPKQNDVFPAENEFSYRICVDHKAYKRDCEAGQIYDDQQKDCIDPKERFAILLPGVVASCTEQDGFFANVKPNLFTVCCDGNSYVYKCPLGTCFNLALGLCTFSCGSGGSGDRYIGA